MRATGRWALGGLFVGFHLAAHAADPPLRLEVVDSGGTVQVRVSAEGEPIFIPACRGVGWEVYDPASSTYAPVSGEPCGPMAPAIQITPEPVSFTYASKHPGAHVVRPIVVYGIGCRPGRAFELAGCEQVMTLVGQNITTR